MPYWVKRRVGLIIDDVRAAEAANHYCIDATIDGVRRSVVVLVDDETDGLELLSADYENYLGQFVEAVSLPKLVLRVHRGEKIKFPLDMRTLPPKRYEE
ncbi:MAG: hypothetical protein QM820_20755 [Minicystis sp.]